MLMLQQRMSTNEAHALSAALTDLVEAEAHLFFTLRRTGAAEPGSVGLRSRKRLSTLHSNTRLKHSAKRVRSVLVDRLHEEP